jgi:hypothetical protein
VRGCGIEIVVGYGDLSIEQVVLELFEIGLARGRG